MRKFTVALLGFILIAPALRADALTGTHVYIEPSAVYGAYLARDYKDAYGTAVAIGVSFAKHHSIEVEAMDFKTEYNYNFSNSYGGSYESKLTVIPVLATYKYSILLGKGFSLSGGISAGVTCEKIKTAATVVSTVYLNSSVTHVYEGSWTEKETVHPFTYGGQVGFTYALAQHATLTLGVKAFHARSSKITWLAETDTYVTTHLGARFTF